MHNCNISWHYTNHAGLVALLLKLKQKEVFEPIVQTVQIKQKTIKYHPTQKLWGGLVSYLAGAKAVVEINKRVRSDPVLASLVSANGCPEQSVIQATLSSATKENGEQMQQALRQIFQSHSQAYRHNYEKSWQILDGDMSGQTCGATAEQATKGYFARKRARRGRQIGRVVASNYGEIVWENLYPGTVQLNKALPELVEAAEAVLDLSPEKRARTLWRVDGGGGSQGDVNYLLHKGYFVLTKDYSLARARKLAKSVPVWTTDPTTPQRQVGWVKTPAPEYEQPVWRIAVRCQKQNGKWTDCVLVTNLPPPLALELSGQAAFLSGRAGAEMLAYAYLYDQRGGGVETSFKEDGQGLGNHHKKSFFGQLLLNLLRTLAHNILVWLKGWLAKTEPKIQPYGIKRLVRDFLTLYGLVYFDQSGHIFSLTFNSADPFARLAFGAWQALLADLDFALILGVT